MEPGHNPSPYPLHKCPLDPWESLSNLPIKELVQQLVLLLTTLTLCRSLIHDSVRWLTPSHMTQQKSCLHTIYHPNFFLHLLIMKLFYSYASLTGTSRLVRKSKLPHKRYCYNILLLRRMLCSCVCVFLFFLKIDFHTWSIALTTAFLQRKSSKRFKFS